MKKILIAALSFLGCACQVHATSVTLDGFETTSGVTAYNVSGLSIINDGTSEVMQGTSSTNDPQLVFTSFGNAPGQNKTFNTNIYTQVEFRLYVDANTTTNAQVYFATAANPNLSEAQSVVVDTSAYRGQWHDYVVTMSGAPNWSGSTLTVLRVDPIADSGKVFKIDYLNILSTGGDLTTLSPQVMNILWRVNVGGVDRMTTFAASERDAFACDGQIFYASQGPATGLEALNRFRGPDHRDSILGSLPGYTLDGPIGYPWSATQTGMDPLLEAYSSTNNDYATVNANFDSLLDAGTGYTLNSNLNGYGFARYDNSYNGADLLTLTVGGTTITSNLIAGGSTWSWTTNGVQFINDSAYGGQIQSSWFFPNRNGQFGGSTFPYTNPTEGGSNFDGHAAGVGNTIGSGQDLFGSPNLVAYNIGNTQVTRAIPLEWDAGAYGGSKTNPVLWPSLSLGKDVTLNYRGLTNVAKYTTTAHTPVTIATDSSNAMQIEIPTAYLRANFSTYYSYDATGNGGTGTLTQHNVPPYDPSAPSGTNVYGTPLPSQPNPLVYGGVIAADPSTNMAMGIYGVGSTATPAGSIGYFSVSNFTNIGGTTGQYDSATVKLDAVALPEGLGTGSLPAGDYTYTSYIITGTLSQVTAAMQNLYTLRDTIPR